MQCHGVIDPPGLPLENFDAIGRWRTTDRQADNAVIDARSVLPNGVAIDGPVELRTQLASRPAMFAQALTEKLMMYALNRELEYFDMPQVRAVVRAAAKDNYKFSSIVRGIVNTEAFRKQGAPPKGLKPVNVARRSHVHHKETHFPKNAAEGRRSQPGVAAAGCHGARRHGACANCCGTEDAHGLFLYSPRRDHAQHRARPGHGSSGRPAAPAPISNSATILSPLEPYKKYVTSFGNLENKASAGSVHTLNPATWLSATRPDGTGSHPHMTATLDQVIAKAIGQDTPLPSLEVASETTVQSAAGGGGSYTTLSFRDAESPLPMEYNPRKVFLQLFGEGDNAGGARVHQPSDAAAFWISFRTARKNCRLNSEITTAPFSTAIWKPFARSSGERRRPEQRIFPV